MNPLESYIRELRDIRSSGAAVPETSYYTPLANLLNDIGKTLKPRVRCIMQLQNQGAGFPDGGLFTLDQLQRASASEPLLGQLPARGVIEVKSTSDDAWVTADGPQVSKYWGKYRQVLVTNYRDFVLVGQDLDGNPVKLESYRLAESEATFWAATAQPRKLAEAQNNRLTEYLKRVMQYAAPLADPRDVAWFLASHAREARACIGQVRLPALAVIRRALEEALGMTFVGPRGEHFFRSSLVQTLFYGVFSAWILWSKEHPPTQRTAWFDWRTSAHYLRVPILRKLFYEMTDPGRLETLHVDNVLKWAELTLNRVDRATFFARFEEGQAVQYFYEPFLEAFDPELRKELGVWYTPREVVRYMVERVDAVLREDLGISDGLADPCVYVLDPCCGTGAYLIEVLKRIAKTLEDKGEDALGSYDVKRAAMERVFGFEILPAPFVVAHLQLGVLLQNLGTPLSDSRRERVGVYLTNALTGWEPPKGPKRQLSFPELEEERDAAEHVKRDTPILVVLGNPPYNAFAGVSPKEEEGLVEPYKEGLISEWKIRKFNLDDLYVRFFRLAERRIAEQTGRGVVCYISNFSYLGDPSFVVMRKRFLSEFDQLWFDALNGDSRETGKLTPDGKPDPSVFSTEYNPEGIRLGTAIGLMVRKAVRAPQSVVRSRNFWGVTKRTDLLESLKAGDFDAQYTLAQPSRSNRFSFHPLTLSAQYMAWPSIIELCAETPISGLAEKWKGALVDIDREALEKRLQMYYDRKVEWAELKALDTGLTEDAGGFNAKAARPKVQAAEKFNPDRIIRYALYPFDLRWCYYTPVASLWNRPRPLLRAQYWPGNRFLVVRMMAERPHEGVPVIVSSALPDHHLLRPNVVAIPVRLRSRDASHGRGAANQLELLTPALSAGSEPIGNLSAKARSYLASLGIESPDMDPEMAEVPWMHTLAVVYSPAYLVENADGIRQDWPRVPLPDTKELLLDSAALGRQIAALLETEVPARGVTVGPIRPELRAVAVITRAGGGALDPNVGDLDITAGWGHGRKGGVIMPGQGKAVSRPYTSSERESLDGGAKALGLTAEQAIARLGEVTYDIYLNDVAYWKNIPANVWNYTIGGYQVIKKWLSYRERNLLGRSLTNDEAREAMNIARRITAILLLEPALDANYKTIKQTPYVWPTAREYDGYPAGSNQ
jgi:Type ISP C-terminal specificity domain/N-6 DNA Methylase